MLEDPEDEDGDISGVGAKLCVQGSGGNVD